MKKSGECKENLGPGSKIFRVMKMMCFLMLCYGTGLGGRGLAQNQVVSVDMKNCNVGGVSSGDSRSKRVFVYVQE